MSRKLDPPSELDLTQLPRLRDLSDPPTRLWIRGSLPAAPSVAIVGTRRADDASLAFAHQLALDLVGLGLGVISGGADGVDAAAHEGALEGSGKTWVVMPTPLERPYPTRHRRLFQRVLDHGGGWLSERKHGDPMHRSHFLMRNRLIAALADAVVVVQAPARSGALSTASRAKRLGRPLFVVPASPWCKRSEGGVRLLSRGALVCSSAADVAHHLGLKVKRRRKKRSPVVKDPEQRAVLRALGPQPLPVHEIVDVTGFGVARVRVALVRLAARDLVDQRPSGWLRIA